MADQKYDKVFKELGERYRKLRLARKMVQEDVIEHGFSVRHYQQLEAGRPHSLTTLFRIAKMFQVDPAKLISGLVKTMPGTVPTPTAVIRRNNSKI